MIHYGKSSVAAAETVKKIEALGVKAVWTPHHFIISCQFDQLIWLSLQVAISADQESDTFGQDLVQETLKAFNTETIDIIVNNAVSGFLKLDMDLAGEPHVARYDAVGTHDSVSNREPACATRMLNQSPSRILIGCFEPMSVARFYWCRLLFHILLRPEVASWMSAASSLGPVVFLCILQPRRHWAPSLSDGEKSWPRKESQWTRFCQVPLKPIWYSQTIIRSCKSLGSSSTLRETARQRKLQRQFFSWQVPWHRISHVSKCLSTEGWHI